MQFQLSEEHLMIQKAARDFAVNECVPGVIERDDLQKFPKEQIEKLEGKQKDLQKNLSLSESLYFP